MSHGRGDLRLTRWTEGKKHGSKSRGSAECKKGVRVPKGEGRKEKECSTPRPLKRGYTIFPKKEKRKTIRGEGTKALGDPHHLKKG